MKRMLLAAVVVGLVAEISWADWGGPSGPGPASGYKGAVLPPISGPNTLLGMSDPHNGVAADKYGLNPRIRKLFRLGPHGQQPQVPPSYYYPLMGYGQGGPAYNPHGYPIGAYGPAQGTLVFPHHPFIRSPRDYFMLDLNR